MTNASMKSEILPISTPDDRTGHTCAFEFVPNSKRPREIYIVFDGQRIAMRAYSVTESRGVWTPLVEGYEVIDETPDQVAVYFGDERLH
jgi:hypothetical protein